MINGFWKTVISLFLCSILLFVTSCSNNQDDEKLETHPPVITFDNGTGIYTVKVLKSITITPVVTGATDPVYTWKDDNGKIVGSDLSYTYSPKVTGEVYLKFRVDSKNGSAEEELRIDVVDKMVPSVSLIPLYTTYIGKDVTIEPSINFTEGAEYQWTLNGKTVGSEAAYTFEATEKGQFNIQLVVTNEDGSGKATTSILVSDKPEINIVFTSESMTVPQGRAACVAPIITDTTSNATYVWQLDGVIQQGETQPTFTFTPSQPGNYQVKVTGTDGEVEKSATQTVICLESDEARYYRAPTSGSSDTRITVFDLMPAPGQFVGQISGSTQAEANRFAEKRINEDRNYISLGAWGGYIVVGLDHSIYNKDDGYDFYILGNAFNGSSEPGIVYVMQDENGNGKPDDTWYELRGSETGKAETYQNYEVTYYRPSRANMPVQWMDNRLNYGTIDLGPSFPAWMKENEYTLRGTRLKANTRHQGIWINDAYPWGYADNWGTDFDGGENPNADVAGNGFKIENAMYPNGQKVDLRYVDFIKVQTGVQSQAGVLGEVSTEVFGFVDNQMEKAPATLQ
ncbi:PKD-like domain-containing protein [Proteiniphilum sp. UBA5384]|uniref:PKD-like domain-containing protein n=1 Tax=Proteiniphilum sp. UBA5384 TaxID=1947279 RepID=UPI0025FCAAAD|nr:PKD-like domain-containing protein [Proteiniphilum sp. UBA5384]